MRFALILETYNELRSRLLDFLQPKNKEEEKKGASVEAEKLGSGRVIPIKQVKYISCQPLHLNRILWRDFI